MRTWGMIGLWLFCSTTQAGDCRVRATTVRLESGFTLVPFAVPVAVPVATLQNPTVLYGYTAQQHTPLQNTPAKATESSSSVRGGSRSAAETILVKHCGECHTGTTAPGKLSFFDEQAHLLRELPRQAILEMASPDAAGSQQMPPGERPKLSSEELQVIRDWAKPSRSLKY